MMRSPTIDERNARILILWLRRPRKRRTDAHVLEFFQWLSMTEPRLLPEPPGALEQLSAVLREYLLPAPGKGERSV